MLKRLLDRIASRVRLGVAMLKDIAGVGRRDRDVNEDIVIARGVGPWDVVEGCGRCVEVHTTTEWVRRRIRFRNRWDRGIGTSASSRSISTGDDDGAFAVFVVLGLGLGASGDGDTLMACRRREEVWMPRERMAGYFHG